MSALGEQADSGEARDYIASLGISPDHSGNIITYHILTI